jgi:predicted RNA-binding Zn ribbon-like protein
METGTVLFEAWVPAGGFKLERRKGKTPEGAAITTDWLVPTWASDGLTVTHPCAEQPCIHRVLAECPHNQVVKVASLFGLLTATGKVLPPEPVDVWHRESRALRNTTTLWDAIAGKDGAALHRALPQHQAAKGKELFRLAREHLARKVTEKIAGGRLELIAPPDEGTSQFVIRHRPARLIDAIWQQFAGEIAGMMTAARCPAPGCGRWFPRSVGRSDRQFCSHACRMRAWRKLPAG